MAMVLGFAGKVAHWYQHAWKYQIHVNIYCIHTYIQQQIISSRKVVVDRCMWPKWLDGVKRQTMIPKSFKKGLAAYLPLTAPLRLPIWRSSWFIMICCICHGLSTIYICTHISMDFSMVYHRCQMKRDSPKSPCAGCIADRQQCWHLTGHSATADWWKTVPCLQNGY